MKGSIKFESSVGNDSGIEQELYAAVSDNNIGRVKELLRHVCPDIIRADQGNFLFKACSSGFTEIVRLLLDNGVNIDPTIMGWTPLHYACGSSKSNAEIVRCLIKAGCDVNAKDVDGQTALHRACNIGHPEMVRLLLAAGADVETENDFGVTPLDIAIDKTAIDAAWPLMVPHKIAKGLSHEKVLEIIQELAPEAYFSKWAQTPLSPGRM